MIATPLRERRAQVPGAAHRDRPGAGSTAARARGRGRERALSSTSASSLMPREEHRLVHHRKARVGEARARARSTAGVSSFGWLKCVITQIGWCLRSARTSSRGDAHRQRHRDARREADRLDGRDRADATERARSRRSVAIASGSPPLTMTSRISGCAAIHANAGSRRLERDRRRRRRRPCASACRSGSRRRSDRSRGAGRDPDSDARDAARPRARPRRAGRRGRPATSCGLVDARHALHGGSGHARIVRDRRARGSTA